MPLHNLCRAYNNLVVAVTQLSGPEDPRRLVADEILALMGRRRMNQTALAREINMSQPALSRRLNAELAFDLDELVRIADALESSVGALVATIRSGRFARVLRYDLGIRPPLQLVPAVTGQLALDFESQPDRRLTAVGRDLRAG